METNTRIAISIILCFFIYLFFKEKRILLNKSSPKPIIITKDELIRHSYRFKHNYVAMLGEGYFSPSRAGESSVHVHLKEENIVYGDFNNDNIQDAFIGLILHTSAGSEPKFNPGLIENLYLVTGKSGEVESYNCPGSIKFDDFKNLYIKNNYIMNSNNSYLYYFNKNGKTVLHDGYPNSKPIFKKGRCVASELISE